MALSHILQRLRLFHCIIYWDNPCMDWEQLFVLGPELHLVVSVEVILCSSSLSQSQGRRQCRRSLFCTSAAVWKAHCSLSCLRFFLGLGVCLGFFNGLRWPESCWENRQQKALVSTQHSSQIVSRSITTRIFYLINHLPLLWFYRVTSLE